MPKKYFSQIIHRRPAAGRLDLIGPQQADRLAAGRLLARLARVGLGLGWPRREGEGGSCRRGRAPVGLPRADRPAAGRQGAAPPRTRLAGCSLRPYPPLPPFFFSPSSLLLLFFSVLTFSPLYTKMPPIYTPK